MTRTQHDGSRGNGLAPSAPGLPGETSPSHRTGVAWMIGALALAGGLVIGAVAVHYGFEKPALQVAQARIIQYEQDLSAVRGRLDQMGSRAAALEASLRVEESTRRGLEEQLRILQDELGSSKDTIAFYEQLIPPGPKGAVTVRALEFERNGPTLSYRALLMRSGANESLFKGSLQFVASGTQEGEQVSVTLTPVLLSRGESGDAAGGSVEEGDAASRLLQVEFANFQRSSGVLAIPEGFEPQSITVNVLEGDAVRTTRSAEVPPRR